MTLLQNVEDVKGETYILFFFFFFGYCLLVAFDIIFLGGAHNIHVITHYLCSWLSTEPGTAFEGVGYLLCPVRDTTGTYRAVL